MAVADLLPDAVVVVVHTEGWSHFSQSPQDVEAVASQRGLTDRVKVPRPGASLAVDAVTSRPVSCAP
jgi:hypothetical protein